MYQKIAKWTCLILILVSVAILVWGTVSGFESNGGAAIDVILRWGYALFGAAVVLAIGLAIFVSVANDPKSLIKMGAVLAGVAALVFVAYILASGDPLMNYLGEQPEQGTLKLTDTILNLTYICGAGAILSIVAGEIISAVRK